MPAIGHSQATLESMWTRAQAMDWANGLKRWPTRRYRLEGSRAGNSRLVGKTMAEDLKSQYGGKIVELIPLPAPKDTRSAYDVAAEDMPSCPRCEVKPGEACVWPSGGKRWPHRAREKAAEK